MAAQATNASPPAPTEEQPPEIEVSITVTATRTDSRLEDQPMRVEVLEREEIEEKMLMTPGDIVMMLNEMGGMRVQATSPSLGAASVRVQGMRGRYTRFLSDGLPLFGEVGGLGLLQIPPMDLGQVEVIKGVASSLYGAGAMGGVVNLVSRRPGDEAEREFLLNRSTRGATDAVLLYSAPLSDGWGLTLLGGGHWQERADVDDDGWADLPSYARGVVRPRCSGTTATGNRFFATAGVTAEDRDGGTAGCRLRGHLSKRSTHGASTAALSINAVCAARTSSPRGRRGRSSATTTSSARIARARPARHGFRRGRRCAAPPDAHTWVAGAALEHDRYTATDVPRFDHAFTIPGVFVQDDVELRRGCR